MLDPNQGIICESVRLGGEMRLTQIWSIDPVSPDPERIRLAAELLRNDALVVFPTETVYGLGANALSDTAVSGIFEAKGRPATNPLIVHVLDSDAARSLVRDWPPEASELTRRFWPGPLTLVLPKAEGIPARVTAGGDTVAIRSPQNSVARALLAAAGLPIAAPSANRSGQLSPTSAQHVWDDLNGRVDLILDGGSCTLGIESTVVDLSGTVPRLLRPGSISPESLREVLGLLLIGPAGASEEPLRSPGLLAKHYAPRTPLRLFSLPGELSPQLVAVSAVLSFGFWIGKTPPRLLIEMPTHEEKYAQQLYEQLHFVDQRGVETILVQLPPEKESWLAIHDRLQRASA
jgi:L-threonylcarbamoyladenylate synthase